MSQRANEPRSSTRDRVVNEAAAVRGAERLDTAAIAARVRAARSREGGRRRVSKPFRDLVRADRRLSRAAQRLARASARGLATYREGQRASAQARRDGEIRDQPINAAEGLAVAMVEARRVPVDLARALSTRSGVRVLRGTLRLLLLPLSPLLR